MESVLGGGEEPCSSWPSWIDGRSFAASLLSRTLSDGKNDDGYIDYIVGNKNNCTDFGIFE